MLANLDSPYVQMIAMATGKRGMQRRVKPNLAVAGSWATGVVVQGSRVSHFQEKRPTAENLGVRKTLDVVFRLKEVPLTVITTSRNQALAYL